MTQNEYDKWYRELNETQKEVTDEFFAWKEKASKGKCRRRCGEVDSV